MLQFDVLITSYNRPSTLRSCLASFDKVPPKELASIQFLILEADFESEKIINDILVGYTTNIIKMKQILNPGASRNILISSAESEYLCFIDDDTVLPSGYFTRGIEIINEFEPDLFGGPDQFAEEFSNKQKAMGELLASSLVMGPTSMRHSKNLKENLIVNESSLTLCNMWLKKNILTSNDIYFNENLRRCEENELLEQLTARGISMHYFSSLFLYHLRRESLSKLGRIQILSGYYRGVCFYKDFKTWKNYFIFPALTGLFLLFFLWLPASLQLFLILAHSLIAIKICYAILIKYKSIALAIWSWAALVIIHVCFSLGLIMGIFLGWKDAR